MQTTLARLPPRPVPWVRDFALVGAATGFLAPAVFFMGDELGYATLTGVGGAAAGVALGVTTAYAMAGRMRRMRRLWLFPLGLTVGLLWGAIAGAMPWIADMPRGMFGLSVVIAAIAGGLQLGWFWFAYCVRRVNHRSTWPVVLAACALSSLLGFAATNVLFGVVRPFTSSAAGCKCDV